VEEDDERKSRKQSSNGQHRVRATEMSTASTAPLFEGSKTYSSLLFLKSGK
jgi:hypothetical protein